MKVTRILPIALGLTVIVGVGVWGVRASGQAPAAKAAAKPIGPHKQANLPPLPFGPRDPLPRPPQVVAAVFQFAAEHPEILNYIPCYCGCERMGHTGNDDCFVKQRAPNGDVVAWEPHGTECAVCIDVGRDAMQMYSSGASVRDIRTAIEKKYAASHQSHTPTPPPPAK
jgi:hypothetical protein